jgi:hypothetical protein
MPKVFNRAIQVAGEDLKVGTPVVTVLDFDALGFVTRAKGKTLPTDGDKGYAKGCEFTRTTKKSILCFQQANSHIKTARLRFNG